MGGRGYLIDCLRAGRRAAKCRRTLGTGSAVSSKQVSKKYDLKNLCGSNHDVPQNSRTDFRKVADDKL